MSARFEGIHYTINCFVGEHKLEKEAEELWGKEWEPDGDNEMIEELIDHIEGERNFYWVDVMDDDHYEITYSHSDENLYDLRKTLKLALLQLQTYSDNDLIIAEGETRSIPELLKELGKEGI